MYNISHYHMYINLPLSHMHMHLITLSSSLSYYLSYYSNLSIHLPYNISYLFTYSSSMLNHTCLSNTNMHMSDLLHSLSLHYLHYLFPDFIYSSSSVYLLYLAMYTNSLMLMSSHSRLHNMYYSSALYYLHHNWPSYMFMSLMLSYPTYSLPDILHTSYFHLLHYLIHPDRTNNIFHFHLHLFMYYSLYYYLSSYNHLLLDLLSFTNISSSLILHLYMFTLTTDFHYSLHSSLSTSLLVHHHSLLD